VTDLANRYGAPSALRRRALLALVVVIAVAGLSWLAWVVVYQSTPKVQSDLTSFTVPDDHTVTASVTVVRSAADVVATCSLRAISEDHSIVGETTTVVDSGARTQRIEVSIRTERRATTVDLKGCTAPGQAEPR
jgi:hypothetical protein